MPNTIDVRTFGAKGDGRTDDTQALQKAIAQARQTGADLNFTSGTYLITRRLDFDGFNGQNITGTGATIKTATTYRQQTLEGMFNFNNARDVKLSGFTFDGNEKNMPSGMSYLHAVNFRNSQNVEVSNNITRNTVGNGFCFTDTDNPNVHHNTISGWMHGGIEFKRANNLIATDNVITGVGDKGPSSGMNGDRRNSGTAGILITGTATGGDRSLEPPHSGARVERNVIKDAPGGAIKIEDQNNVRVVSNSIADFGKDGIKVQPINQNANREKFVHDAVIEDNVVTGFHNWRGDGSGYIVLQGLKNGRIEGNTVLGNNGRPPEILPKWQVEIGVRLNRFPDWSIQPENITVKDNNIWGTRAAYYLDVKQSTVNITGNDVRTRYTSADVAGLPPLPAPTTGSEPTPVPTPTPTPTPTPAPSDDDSARAGTPGNDTLAGGKGQDRLAGDAADGTTVNALVKSALPNGLESFHAALRTSFGDDVLIGHEGDDTLIGGLGSDTLDGGTGNDILRGDTARALTLPWGTVARSQNVIANDALWGRDGHDLLDGGLGDDIAVGGSGNDTLYGGFGRDVLHGDAMPVARIDLSLAGTSTRNGPPKFRLLLDGKQVGAEQTVTADYSKQQWQAFSFALDKPVAAGKLEIEFANDEYFGTTEDRNLWVNGVRVNGANLALGAGTYDLIGSGQDRVGQSNMFANGILRFSLEGFGTAGDDFLDGGYDDDVLEGGGGKDLLYGGLGSDTLMGGAGNDTLYAMGSSRANGMDLLTFLPGNGLPAGGSRIQNTILVRASGDAFDGPARIRVMVDGKDISGQMTITAVHKAGAEQVLEVRTDADLVAARQLQVQFTNDAWGGSADKDRNAYIHGISVNGVVIDNKSGRYESKPGTFVTALNQQGQQFLPGGGILHYNLDAVRGIRNAVLDAAQSRSSDTLGTADEAKSQNILSGNAGDDTLYGGDGSDTYRFGRGDDLDRIINLGADTRTMDAVQFGSGITGQDLWFSRAGADLKVSVVGGKDAVTIDKWFTNPSTQVDRFQLADGKALASRDVQLLVDAMSAFKVTDAALVEALPANVTQALDGVIAAVWK